MSIKMKTDNPELKLAEEYVRDTGFNIFLTGRAGTGKTTFLRNLKESAQKRLVVTAPTGVAAINAGGVTLHSFFQLPFGPYVPGSKNSSSIYRFSRKKIDIIKSLDLLIIDEISMVRADLLDGVDSVLKRHRRSDQPFGGVQLLMIGDLFQLPPVVKDEDWQILQPYYSSPYFFSSNALANTRMVTIELTRIYRQSDSRFIHLLNQVRNDSLDETSLAQLNSRYIAGYTPKEGDGVITLSTHNRNADNINATRLADLKRKLHIFSAKIEGEFPVHAYPTASVLKLKKGAQVMFVRNDNSPDKRYFNGKIGRITQITDETIRIRCPGDHEEIIVEPDTWENIEYSLDDHTLEINEKLVGGFTQYPIRLAWAITIHKSQGLTFNRAVIDAQAAFAYGQVYVALSRCRTLDGMVLSTTLAARAMKTDPVVRTFNEEARHNRPSNEQLEKEKNQYQQRLLVECFDFQQLRGMLRRLVGMVMGSSGLISVSGVPDFKNLEKSSEEEIFSVGDKFIRQLTGLFSTTTLPSTDGVILDRISKASTYFYEKLTSGLCNALPRLHLETDNKTLGKKADFLLKLVKEEAVVKQSAVKSCSSGFSPSDYFRALSAGSLYAGEKKTPTVAPIYAESDISHPELFASLKAWRSEKAKGDGLAHYQVLHQKTLIQIAVHLPNTVSSLLTIKGLGKKLVERYGEELVSLVGGYREKHGIETVVLPPPSQVESIPKKNHAPRGSKKPKVDTKQASLDLFEQGMTLPQIAETRGLVVSTIEGHLVHWIEQGKVDIKRLLSSTKRKIIEQTLSKMTGKNLNEVKQALGADFSYGEIKLVQTHKKISSENDG